MIEKIQLLGAEVPRHLCRTLKAVGASPLFYGQIVATLLTKVVTSKEESRALKVVPLMELLNREILTRARNFTRAELVQRFADNDVWWCPVRMPHNFAATKQAHANGAFGLDEDGAFLTASPCDLDHNFTPCTRPSPTLGEHNNELEL